MTQRHLFTMHDIQVSFSKSTISKGRDYAYGGLVENMRWTSDNAITAEVQGTSARPYDVELIVIERDGRSYINSECSCPVGHQCKHGAATAFEAVQALGQEVIQRVMAESPLLDVMAKTLPRIAPTPKPYNPVEQWLHSLETPSSDVIVQPSATKQIIYHIEPPIRNEAFRISPLSVTILKSGAFSKSTSYYNAEKLNHYKVVSFLTEEDITLLRMIDAFTDARYAQTQFSIPCGKKANLILEMAMNTERCYAGALDNPAHSLHYGEPLQGRIAWNIQADGSQKTQLTSRNNTASLQPLGLEPLHYLCPATRTIGILETELHPKQFLALYHAPAVPAEQIEHVRQKMSKIIPNAEEHLLPQAVDVQRIMGTPIPTLTLGAVKAQPIKQNSWGQTKPNGAPCALATAELSFTYEGKRFAWQDSITEFTRMHQGVAHVIGRNAQEEQRFEKQLFAEGIQTALHDVAHHYQTHSAHAYKRIITNKYGVAHANKEVDAQWRHVMQNIIPQLKEQGWKIRIEKDFPYNIIEADDTWYAEIDESAQPHKGSGIDWFGLELGIHVDGEKMNLVPILLKLLEHQTNIFDVIAALPQGEPLIIPLADGRRLALPAPRAQMVLQTLHNLFHGERLNKNGQLTLQHTDAALLAEMQAAMESLSVRWIGGEKLRMIGERLRNFKEITPVQPPATFHGTLRPYQQEGLSWMQFLRSYDLAGILADDMGLGKTVQLLAHIATEKAEGRLTHPFLILAPTSLMGNWRREAQKFAPSLSVLVSHGSERKEQFDRIAEHDIVLTTYPLLPRDKDTLLQHHFHTIVLDEAQTIKNARAKITQIALQLKSQHRLCLTGTPLENHLGELWSLFNFLLPGYLGDTRTFTSLFRNPIEKEKDREKSLSLSRKVQPFILRRTKQDVATELPPKTETLRIIELEGDQRDLYETIRTAMHEKVQAEIATKGLNKSHIIVLDALLKLRQTCCDPSLLSSVEAAKKVKESAKRTALLEMLIPMVEEGRKILLFSQFTSMLDIIIKDLKAHAIPYVTITGKTKDRETPIKQFQEGDVPLFLISLKAGGVGLNLTAADTVIHYDPWWNPAAEMQATDRAYRIGQDKPVFVYKLITANTVEEKILHMQEHKRLLMDGLFDPSNKSAAHLTTEDISILFEPLVAPNG
ncbi:MAG: helicase SNF2 [Alphaproteobacteria bacterium]|nr:MAG: helicase SNF2 [Alphaproteobacteria bacterium]TAF76238.1 MAG: helicase SNF2 [Alphaproteobacteria bacterium]